MAAIPSSVPLVLGSLAGDALDREIADLEARLAAAKQRRAAHLATETLETSETSATSQTPVAPVATLTPAQHFYLLLSDSALPLGAFAFSSGLESFLAHGKAAVVAGGQAAARSGPDAFAAFLPLSVASYGAASLPFVLAAHDASCRPVASADVSTTLAATLERLDDLYDATIVCTVGRRASVAQGRALLAVWERALAPSVVASGQADPLRPFAQQVKRAGMAASTTSGNPWLADPPAASAHLPPLFGAIAGLAGLDRRQTADVFVFSHVKALVSAAVRASLMGPYQAQRLLASERVRQLVASAVDRSWTVAVEEAGQAAPVVDLWMGRHELLYSRIFNS